MGDKLFSIVCFMLMTYSCLARTRILHENSDRNIFILAGQSNMVGVGGHLDNTTTPPECRPTPQILMFDVHQKWEVAKDPLHRGIDVNHGNVAGPGMPFAHRILEEDPNFGTIGLVPCARAGTPITRWKKGLPNYNQLVDRSRAAMRSGGRVQAIFWYQGESDTKTEADAKAYKGRLEEFIADVRSDLGLPEVPVIVVAIISNMGPYMEVVREAQLGLKVSNVITIDALGAQLNPPPDEKHLSLAGTIDVGHRLADAFLKISRPC